ncbi:hypothetical protein RFN29_30435 [Mesorhizobium sp. VK22B]|uniref:Uncharacterized protein n=1 Tax=Mesorhizobium captivum TaxID=3072319 RepID=A0ABU4Z9C7_9HYPH|nr:hypothetical protein [Mesorhizobium sp. VK22B]MDX8495868.1 hypothetical protein [Mesorhizobium sp. VK22B]
MTNPRTSRHGYLADGLSGLKQWAARHEGPVEPVQTNWTIIPGNDNAGADETTDKRAQRRWAQRPTVSETMREISKADYRELPIADKKKAKGEHDVELYPIGGDVEYGSSVDDDGKRHKVVVRIGKLRFSDGTQKERGFSRGPDGKLVQRDLTMPIGAMLGTRDQQERTLGGDGDVSNNRNYLAVYGAKGANSVRRKEREPDKKLSREDAQAELQLAIANTPKIPATTMCEPGFPWQPAYLRELFLGLEKGKKGETGSIAWEDAFTHTVNREVWAESIANLKDEDRRVLDGAMTASSLADIGSGGHRRTRERRGRRQLHAANDNLVAALKKFAA